MSRQLLNKRTVAIACGGTGGHLFPGLAVARELIDLNCRVIVLISPKEIDQTAAQQASGMEVVTLPAVGLTQGRKLAFLRGFISSYRASSALFRKERPAAALAMGGFTSAPPLLAARRFGAKVYLHESNTIPGRANRWLSWIVEHAFVGFEESLSRLHATTGEVTGTPVRPQFQPIAAREARARLGLAPDVPTILVTGGSQGASGLNQLVCDALPLLKEALPAIQFLHLTGINDVAKVQQAYVREDVPALVSPFLAEMNLALGAADLAISRSGASSLAELAAMAVPSILVPFPAATDDHQRHNAAAYERTGAAIVCDQKATTTQGFANQVLRILQEQALAEKMRKEAAKWHRPHAARQIAEIILRQVESRCARSSGSSKTTHSDASRHPMASAEASGK
jgi:UDP-N-acetylglucosamine--N-acetylmuramyl-(pentapeptide) pyrophosphoryl-undecaprenol N-acetylglucosamine transferase